MDRLKARKILTPFLLRGKREKEDAGPWYLTEGLTVDDVIVAYQAKGATSYAESKINLAHPGSCNLVNYTGELSWSSAKGWEGTSEGGSLRSSDQYIDDLADSIKTLIGRFSDFTPLTSGYVIAHQGTRMWPLADLGEGGPYGFRVMCGNSSAATASSFAPTHGVIGMVIGCSSYYPDGKVMGYLDGVNICESAPHQDMMPVGTGYFEVGSNLKPTAFIQASVAYRKVLTPTQMATISAQMANIA